MLIGDCIHSFDIDGGDSFLDIFADTSDFANVEEQSVEISHAVFKYITECDVVYNKYLCHKDRSIVMGYDEASDVHYFYEWINSPSPAREAVEKLREAQALIEEAMVLFKAESDEAYANDPIPHRGNVTGDLVAKHQHLYNMVHQLKEMIYWVTNALDRWHPRINDSLNTRP